MIKKNKRIGFWLGKKRSKETKEKISKKLTGHISWSKGKTGIHTEEVRKRIGEKLFGRKRSISIIEKIKKNNAKYWKNHKRPEISGKNHYKWKGGITPINKMIRNSLEMKLWRESVFKRDNYQCIWGGKKHGNKLNADHIKPFSLFPELRFAIDNGRTLCVKCHNSLTSKQHKEKIYKNSMDTRFKIKI